MDPIYCPCDVDVCLILQKMSVMGQTGVIKKNVCMNDEMRKTESFRLPCAVRSVLRRSSALRYVYLPMREEGRVSSLKRAKSPSATGLRHAKNELRKFVTSASVFFLRSARGVVLDPA